MIANVTCSDWLKSLLPVFQPMRSNTNHSNIMIIIFWCISWPHFLKLKIEVLLALSSCLVDLLSLKNHSKYTLIWGCRDDAVVRALTSCLCGLGSISRSGVICGLSLLVLYSAARGFLRVLWFPISSKTSIWLDLC